MEALTANVLAGDVRIGARQERQNQVVPKSVRMNPQGILDALGNDNNENAVALTNLEPI